MRIFILLSIFTLILTGIAKTLDSTNFLSQIDTNSAIKAWSVKETVSSVTLFSNLLRLEMFTFTGNLNMSKIPNMADATFYTSFSISNSIFGNSWAPTLQVGSSNPVRISIQGIDDANTFDATPGTLNSPNATIILTYQDDSTLTCPGTKLEINITGNVFQPKMSLLAVNTVYGISLNPSSSGLESSINITFVLNVAILIFLPFVSLVIYQKIIKKIDERRQLGRSINPGALIMIQLFEIPFIFLTCWHLLLYPKIGIGVVSFIQLLIDIHLAVKLVERTVPGMKRWKLWCYRIFLFLFGAFCLIDKDLLSIIFLMLFFLHPLPQIVKNKLSRKPNRWSFRTWVIFICPKLVYLFIFPKYQFDISSYYAPLIIGFEALILQLVILFIVQRPKAGRLSVPLLNPPNHQGNANPNNPYLVLTDNEIRYWVMRRAALDKFEIREPAPPGYAFSRAGMAIEQTCPICLEDFLPENTNYRTSFVLREVLKTPCNHLFHVSCLKDWRKTKSTCPNCRVTLPPLK